MHEKNILEYPFAFFKNIKMRDIMDKSKIDAAIPITATSLTSRRVLVMTRLYGYKVRSL